MTPEVTTAVEEIRAAFAGHRIDVTSEAQGGAYVVVQDLELGGRYQPSASWVGFLISFQYPYSDVYPHFIDGAVRRVDGRPHGQGMAGPVPWQGRSAVQVSRRSNRWNPVVDTAATKLAKVLGWIRAQ